MRFLYVKLVGYAGFYHGMGLTEIEVDFARSKFPITVITGPNTCGKSTLLNALNLLPDSNDCFEKGMSASKYLRLLDHDIIYEIFMNHPIDSRGNRAVTKVSILKNGIELNPNGNVSSYKDIIFNEFDLDSNYITLSYLSGNDRGLADKRPGERKKFITNIVSALEVYNDINKNLNKKSNVYKGQLNALGTKINNIGNVDALNSTKVSLMGREQRLKDSIEVLKARVIENTTKLSIQDPDGEIYKKFEELENKIQALKLRVDIATTQVIPSIATIVDGEVSNTSILSKLDTYKIQIDNHTKEYNEYDTQEKVIISQMSSISEDIDKINIRLSKLKEDINPTLEEELIKTNQEIADIQSEFQEFNIGDIDNISQDEINQAVNTISEFITVIDAIYSSVGVNNLPRFIDHYGHLSEDIEEVTNKIDEYRNIIESTNITLAKLESDLNIIKELNNRPSKCKIDSCYFIAKSLSILKEYGSQKDLEKLISDTAKEQVELVKNKTCLEETLPEYKNMLSNEAYLRTITSMLKANERILSKVRVFRHLTDNISLYGRISNGYSFNEYRNLSGLTNISNDLTRYKSLLSIQSTLNNEYNINKDKIKTYNELMEDISSKTGKLESLSEEKKKVITSKNFNSELLTELSNKQSQLIGLYEKYKEYMNDSQELELTQIEFDKIKKNFTSSESLMKQVSDDKISIEAKARELEPISNELKNIDTQLTLLDEYHREFAEINEKYAIIDKLKKYSSPVSGGIQTLFMNLYMSKTLELANQLLGMIFNGQFQLLDYVINQDEFRIPFIGRGLIVDDISSGSTSQICIMGMIINLVLLHQASTKFNITRLDEIDGGLDHQNRYMFVDILQKIVNILQIDQLFIISHSVESALSNVDVIQLAPMTDEETFAGANIIYTYKDRK